MSPFFQRPSIGADVRAQQTVREGIGRRCRISDAALRHRGLLAHEHVTGCTRLPSRCESGARLRNPFNPYELALAAPREKIGREIRRVAVPFPQVGMFLWRVGIRLHHFPVEMPGGMAEHRQSDGQTDEER